MLHSWHELISNPTTKVETCRKCALLRLTTMNGEYLFTKIDKRHSACPSPYHDLEKPTSEDPKKS